MNKRTAPPLSRAVAEVILGKYKSKRMNQDELSRLSGIPVVTLQKKIAGTSPISVQELAEMSAALGLTPQEVLDEAWEKVGGFTSLPNVDATVTPIRRARDMTAAEIDAYQGDRVAHRFEDEADEPE